MKYPDRKFLSLDSTVAQLADLGFTHLTQEETFAARREDMGTLLLEDILKERLGYINRISCKGREYRFSEENIRAAVEKLAYVKYEGLLRTNEAIYEQLTLGLSLEQSVEGYASSFTLRYVDWQDPANNAFHVATRFPVSSPGTGETVWLDIVLFVNGIPFVVIQCAPPGTPIEQVIGHSIRSQQEDHRSVPSGPDPSDENLREPDVYGRIPPGANIFCYAQLLLATNGNTTRFGTIGTPARFWSGWKEPSGEGSPGEEYAGGIRGLCRPDRLLEFIHKFSVFDNGVRKIARYHQYFAVKRVLSRVRVPDGNGRRRGGIVWHTQGSGKSLTMVMLARSLAEEPGVVNPRIVLVTDRKDLDEQIKDTFLACDMAPQRARTGRDLLELVSRQKAGIITTLVHKFDKALNVGKYQDDSIDIFMLIDESHRTQFGAFAARMRQMFPNACYLGFTGTPLMRKEKNNFAKFGGLIDHYTITQAIHDEVIVPLVYEGRHVEIRQDERAMDAWFQKCTQGFPARGKVALKKKYARTMRLGETDAIIYTRALDISRHFRTCYGDSGYKGQLIAPSKAAALAYHRYLTEIGLVSSEVIISPPNNYAPASGTHSPPSGEVLQFWREAIGYHGSEEEYNKRIIHRFKHGEDPEILIVVDKLQTGFDAPCNAVLYITRPLRGHALLQTIARVNRIHQDKHGHLKSFGLIVDYAGILGELDRALTQYSAFEGFDDEDLVSALVPAREEIRQLPGRYADLLELFMNEERELPDDPEICQRLSWDGRLQSAFHERLSRFRRALDVALADDAFLACTPSGELRRYRLDRKRFQKLKTTVDYHGHEPRIEEMPSTCLRMTGSVQLNRPAQVFLFKDLYGDPSPYQAKTPLDPRMVSVSIQANTIAMAARRVLDEHREFDPAFHGKFSRLIQQVMDDFKAKRISDIEYLDRISRIYGRVEKHEYKDVPAVLQGNENAIAFYRVLKPYFPIPVLDAIKDNSTNAIPTHDTAAASQAAIAMDNIFRRHWKVRFWDDRDTIKQVMTDIDDYFYDEVNKTRKHCLSTPQMDEIIDKVIGIAQYRLPGYRERK